jgi:hypothetical protein
MLVAFLLAAPMMPQDKTDEWEVSGAVRYKSFLTKDLRATTLNDYRDYTDYALMELGIDLDFRIPLPFDLEPLSVRAHPYFWIAQERNLCHIGLESEIEYPVCENLDFGYRHYSWHNADDDSPNNKGRTQDSFFATWNFADAELCDSARMEFYVRPQIYAYNTHPFEIKDVYEHDDPTARYELRFGARLDWEKFHANLWPYAQANDAADIRIWGAKGQIAYDLFKNLSVFADVHGIFGEDANLAIIAIGMEIRFR